MSSANTLGKYINKVLDSRETHMLPTNCTEHAYFREHLQIQSSSYLPCLDHKNTPHIEGKPHMDPNNSRFKGTDHIYVLKLYGNHKQEVAIDNHQTQLVLENKKMSVVDKPLQDIFQMTTLGYDKHIFLSIMKNPINYLPPYNMQFVIQQQEEENIGKQ